MKTPLDLSKIVLDQINPKSDYFHDAQLKKQVFIHHSISHPDPSDVIEGWRKKGPRIGACLCIAGKPYSKAASYKDGQIYSVFSSKFWAMHLNTHIEANKVPKRYKDRFHTRYLEKHSIAVMLCNAGSLSWENGKFYTVYRTTVPESQVIEYVDKFRNHRFYHKYSEKQIEGLRKILVYLCDVYNIPSIYQADMWDVSDRALRGTPGIFSHVSVRSDVSDCHPQPELIEMLSELKGEGMTATTLPETFKQEADISVESIKDSESEKTVEDLDKYKENKDKEGKNIDKD
ncbi:MAG: hypothetical protein AAGI07_18675 [Bacteroidota bacterium]